MDMAKLNIVILVAVLMCTLQDCDAGRRSKLKQTPGVLLRDLLNSNSETSTPEPLSPDDLLNTDADYEAAEDTVYRRGDRDPAIDDLLASLTEHGIQSEKPSAHFLLSLYERLTKGEGLSEATGHAHDDSVKQADTIRSFTAQVPPQDGRSDVSMKFHVTGVTARERTQLAELRIKPLNPSGDDEGESSQEDEVSHTGKKHKRTQKIKVTIYRDDQKIKQKNYRVSVHRDSSDGFDVMEITRIVDELLLDVENANDTTVEVTIKNKNKRSGRRRFSRSAVSEEEAMLVIYTQDKDFFKQFRAPLSDLAEREESGENHHHKRRHSKHTEEADQKDSAKSRVSRSAKKGKSRVECQKRDFMVDFESIGWSKWIVYPKRFNAYKCSGRCPSPVDQSFFPTNHAIMQSLMRIHDRAVPRPCCVPTKLQPLSMLYYEYGEIVIRHHENMVVDTCGCR